MEDNRIDLLKLLAGRLERLNVDSKWARRASGTRGEVIKALDQVDKGTSTSPEILDALIRKSLDILTKAAREIPENQTHNK